MFLLVFTWAAFISLSSAWAGVDIAIGASGRSFPSGGTAEFNLGYGRLLWGSEKNPLYGFIRVAADIEAVSDYMSTTAKLEIFPLSAVGVRAGRMWMQSHLDYEDFDCVTYLCRGKFLEDFIEVPLYLGFGRFLFGASYRISRWQRAGEAEDDEQFIEPSSGLNLSASEPDEVQRVRAALFFKFTQRWSVGYAETLFNAGSLADIVGVSEGGQGFEDEDRKSRLWLGLLRYSGQGPFASLGETSFVIGAGEYHSTLLRSDPTVVLAVTFSPIPKLGY